MIVSVAASYMMGLLDGRHPPGRFGMDGGRRPSPGSPAVIGLHGLLRYRWGAEAVLERIAMELRLLAGNPDVPGILLDFDSPGGELAGVPELADLVRRTAGRKRVVSVVNAQATGAAFWIASAAPEVVVTPSGVLGGVGIAEIHRDQSRALALHGVAVTTVASAPGKVERSPFQPLAEGARARWQKEVNAWHSAFVTAVCLGRRLPTASAREWATGRDFLAEEAVDLGLADRVATFDDVYSDMGRR